MIYHNYNTKLNPFPTTHLTGGFFIANSILEVRPSPTGMSTGGVLKTINYERWKAGTQNSPDGDIDSGE